MRGVQNALLIRDFDGLFRHGTVPAGDRALLDWFLRRGDPAAFEAIVNRHGPMVRGVCCRVLGSSHDADDAFQATFLVLVQKAGRLRDSDRLGSWLYGVATRVATRSRSRSANRRDRHQTHFDDLAARDERGQADWRDVGPILDAELGRLPAKYREVLVLCLLEGSTVEEAAGQLACPLGTVKSRLARGREALKNRLTGRGITPAVALAVVAGSNSSASAFASPVPETLIRSTMTLLARSSISPAVVALTQGVIPSMLSKSIAMTTLLCGAAGLSVLGAASWMRSPAQAQEPAAGVAGPAKEMPPGMTELHQTVNNLKQIMLAFHNYEQVNGHLPPAAIYGSDGQPKLSWRVALLPYVEQNGLYNQFHLDEAWDSPHNKTLIARMPAVFVTPSSPTEPGRTRIRGFAGKGSLFDGTKGVRFAEITDGTSNTIAIVLADAAVPWTQPGELPFIAGQPLAKMDQSDPVGFLAGIADGSVRRFSIEREVYFRGLITRNGGEVIDYDRVTPRRNEALPGLRTPVPTDTATITMAPTPGVRSPLPNQSLEERLQRLEDKLDRILQKLEGLPK